MTAEIVCLDVGDVLIRTHPGAHYEALARLAGVGASQVAAVADPMVPELESGRLSFEAFATAIAEGNALAAHPVEALRTAWCQVLGDIDTEVARAAAALARRKRLVFATNTSAEHWAALEPRLAQHGLRAPAVTSFDVGDRKPGDSYFRALRRHIGDAVGTFIDDRPENVRAARWHGLTAHLHTSSTETAALLTILANQR